jgi:hypothetical protein
MKNEPVVFLKTDAEYSWLAVLDPASGKRGRYTVYRVYYWGNKGADIVGREIDLRTARKLADKYEPDKARSKGPNFDHQCDWRKAARMLAKCVVATIQAGGKIGMGTGMVLKMVDGKTSLERWDKDFVEALDFIGIEMVDKKSGNPKKPKKRKAVRGARA